jgi:hypothetical protein
MLCRAAAAIRRLGADVRSGVWFINTGGTREDPASIVEYLVRHETKRSGHDHRRAPRAAALGIAPWWRSGRSATLGLDVVDWIRAS